LTSLTPFSGYPCLVASRTYNVRGIPIGLADMVFGVPSLDHVCIPFLNGLPTVDYSSSAHKNRVLRVERGDGGCVIVVDCLVIAARVSNVWNSSNVANPYCDWSPPHADVSSAIHMTLGNTRTAAIRYGNRDSTLATFGLGIRLAASFLGIMVSESTRAFRRRFAPPTGGAALPAVRAAPRSLS